MLEIKNGGLDQYGAEPFKQQQFGTVGIDGVNKERTLLRIISPCCTCSIRILSKIPHNIKLTYHND